MSATQEDKINTIMLKTGLDPFVIGLALGCEHDWKPGINATNTISENGSTTVGYFEDEICSKCGITKSVWSLIQRAINDPTMPIQSWIVNPDGTVQDASQ